MSHDWITPPPATTTNLTPVVINIAGIAPDTTVKLMLTARARAADGTSATWTGTRTFKRVGAGAASPVGSVIVPTLENDLGAAAWLLSLGLSSNLIIVTCTGALATTITWTVQVELVT